MADHSHVYMVVPKVWIMHVLIIGQWDRKQKSITVVSKNERCDRSHAVLWSKKGLVILLGIKPTNRLYDTTKELQFVSANTVSAI